MPIFSNCGANRADILGTTIAAGAVVVCGAPSFLRRVLVVTANSTTAINITDGVGGPIIGIIAASAAAGTLYVFEMPAKVSINIPQTTGAGNLAIVFD